MEKKLLLLILLQLLIRNIEECIRVGIPFGVYTYSYALNIDNAINEANLGVNPINDGDSIRLVFPTLTEDRRRDLVKVAKKYGEEAKVAIRNIRRDYNDKVKKDKELPEDLAKKLENDIQKATDDAVKNIDASVAKKEKEIMEI